MNGGSKLTNDPDPHWSSTIQSRVARSIQSSTSPIFERTGFHKLLQKADEQANAVIASAACSACFRAPSPQFGMLKHDSKALLKVQEEPGEPEMDTPLSCMQGFSRLHRLAVVAFRSLFFGCEVRGA